MSARPERVHWRCRRGIKEVDLLLEDYFQSRYHALREYDRRAFLELLELPNDRLFSYLLGLATPENSLIEHIVAQIRSQPSN